MRLYDPRLMRLLSFLTRKQDWLLPKDVARTFRTGDRPITSRTVQRWFAFLRAKGGFVYYPYPKANVLGLQDVLVRVRGLRNPEILGVLPFGASFNVEVALADGHPFVSQGYWVPSSAERAFQEYWNAARDLGLLDGMDILTSKNTHTIFSPFQDTITPDGRAELKDPVDNAYFAALLRRNLREKFEVRIGERIRAAPLVIPLVVEHVWQHYSSQHVWRAIRAAGEAHLLKYGRGLLHKSIESPGSALRLLQRQWTDLIAHFEDVFLQPRVFFDWPSLRDATFLSFWMRADPIRATEAALKISERSIVTALKPGLRPEDRCHVAAFVPSNQILPVLRLVNEYHRNRKPPVVAIQDRDATVKLFRPNFCRVDWRLFDPTRLEWDFHADQYIERLKALDVSAA